MGAYDISRVVFDPRKHYASVRMQQGRVMIDDDWNESERIENEERRRSRVDIIGAHGSPDQGFRIESLQIINEPISGVNLIEFDIHTGTYHLGGLRLEMESPDLADPTSRESYRTQRDWLQQSYAEGLAPVLAAGIERYDFVYLEAWRQAVSAVEDDELFEKALAGPDTSTRIRTMRRVHLHESIERDNCPAAWQRLRELWLNDNQGRINEEHELITDARLQVGYIPDAASNDLCSPSIAGGYLGAENQAIRVQLINDTHLTWGFDNASSLYRVQAPAANAIKFLTFPRDQHHWPLAGQVVEILPWSAILPNGEKVANVRGHLSKVDSSFDPDDDNQNLTLVDAIPPGFGEQWQLRSDNADVADIADQFFYLRVWNRGSDLTSDAEIAYTPGTPLTLGSTGLQITITGNERKSNDHWIIAARPETPDQVTPWSLEDGISPHGIRRFYAPLGIIRWTGNADGTTSGEIIRDCRNTFRPLTELETCCTYSVGDGLNSKGDFNSIEDAIAHLPVDGGKICVLPGTHQANVELLNRRDIRISGCGERSIVLPSLERLADPIFFISGSQNIQIDNLSMMTLRGSAIVLRDNNDTLQASQEIMINDNHILACINGIHITVDADKGGDNKITILRNKIGMLDKEDGDVAIFSLADGVLIERNEIFVENPPNPDDPNDPRDPEDPDDPFDPCAEPELFYGVAFPLALFYFNFFLYAQRLFLIAPFVYQYRTKGGIQIGGSSERVRILENKIVGGYGNGITLGHLPQINPDDFTDEAVAVYRTYYNASYVNSFERDELKAFVDKSFLSTLYEISIENNKIQRMGLSGIGVDTFFNLQQTNLVISLEDLTIYRNHIKNCARQIPLDIPDDILNDIAFGGISLADANEAIIQENRLEDNGLSHADPICGLFILNGEKVDITNNHILNNGPFATRVASQIREGRRGGIVVANSFKQFEELVDAQGNIQPVMFDNTFAIKVHNNVIIQPLGHALFLMAFGPVSVVGNQMSSQGVNARNTLNLLAGTVFILNLGISKDLITQVILPKFKEVGNSKYENNWSTGRTQNDQLNQLLTAMQYLPSGRVLFTNNQVTLDLRSAESTIVISSQLIFSLDDVAYNSNQAEVSGFIDAVPGGPTTFDVVVTDAFLVGYSVRSNDNRLQEGFTLALYSLISLGYMNTALGNQSTYCLLLYGTLTPPPALFDGSNSILRRTLCQRDYQSLGTQMAVPAKDYYTTVG